MRGAFKYVRGNLIWRNYLWSLFGLSLLGVSMALLDDLVGIAFRYTWWPVALGWLLYSERFWWRESVLPWRRDRA